MKYLILVFILAFLFRFVLAFVAWHPDMNNHIDWGIRFWQYGPGEFYKSNVWSFGWPNQPPGTVIIFALIRKLYEGVFNFFWWVNVTIPAFPSNIMLFFEQRLYPAFLKLPAILADLGIAYWIFRFLNHNDYRKFALVGAILFLINPVSWYNSSVWGQTDATVNFFALGTLVMLFERKIVWSFVLIALSLFIKASLLTLIPVILIIVFCQRYKMRDVMKAVGVALGLIALLTIPFSKSEPFAWLFTLFTDKVFGWQLHLITANAFNLWSFLAGIHEQPDTQIFGFLQYSTWGYLLFSLLIIPLLYFLYKDPRPLVGIWVSMLVMFASFAFLTGMHERYLYPVFPLMTILVATRLKLFLLYSLLSGIHLLNLYNFWWYPRIEQVVEFLSMQDRLIPRVLGLVITIIFGIFYALFLRLKTSSVTK